MMKKGSIVGSNMIFGIIAILATLTVVNAEAAEVIMEHGKYSQHYISDWATLPTGREIIQANLQKDIGAALGLKENEFNLKTGTGFKSVKAENIAVSKKWEYGDSEEVTLGNLAYKVKWNKIPYHGVLFSYRGYKRVVIENLAIIQDDPDYRTYNAVFVLNCDEVVVRNTYFAGTVGLAHIRIEGCKRVLVENTEIAGIDYFGKGKFRNGAGINILNGTRDAPMTPVLEWLTIQNCYLHDYTSGDGSWRNQDGILLESPANGVLFNCYLENWDRAFADGAIDAGHRNLDVNYAKNHFFRIERNIIKNCSLTKSPGNAGNNILFWTNNIFINAMHEDYHSKGSQYFVNNTYIFEPSSPSLRYDWFYELDNFGGPSYIQNCLIYKPSGQCKFMVTQNATPPVDKWKGLHGDYNVFRLGLYPRDKWIAWNTGINSYGDWQKAGNDLHSIMDVREELGENLLSDTKSGNSGEFTDWTGNTPDGWTKVGETAGSYVVLDAYRCRMVSDGGAVGIKQRILTIGKPYKYSISIQNVKSGTLRIGTGDALAIFSKVSDRTGYFTAYEEDFIIKRDSSPADMSFDNVWVKELEGFPPQDDNIMDVRETLGENLLSDTKSGNSGEFTDWTGNTPDGWTKVGETAGSYVVLDAHRCRMVSDGGAVGIKQRILTIGKLYKYSISIQNVKSGTLRIGSGDALATFGSVSDTTEGYFTAYEEDFIIKRDSSPADISFDNVLVKELEGFSFQDDYFVNRGLGDNFKLSPDSPAANAGCVDYLSPTDVRMKVNRDFKGVSRGSKPSVGAFED